LCISFCSSIKAGLPTGLDNPGNISLEGHSPKTDSANPELTDKSPWPAAERAAVIGAHLKLRCPLRL
jgi:hypothetical protein